MNIDPFRALCICLIFITFTQPQYLQAQKVNHWETAIYANDTWRYFIGNSEPNTFWRLAAFDDSGWSQGKGGFGYGDGDDSTLLPACRSVFLRIPFMVTDTASLVAAIVSIDYDDAFVAYINGIEVARAGLAGLYPPYDASGADHEAKMYQGGLPENFTINPQLLARSLQPGTNIFAIQVHNSSFNSSDLSAIPFLSFGIRDGGVHYRNTPVWFVAPIENTSFQSNLPILSINTNHQLIPNNAAKIDAILRVIHGSSGINYLSDSATGYYGKIGIKIRGSTSASYDQKGYSIETRDANGANRNVKLLDMPSENDWALIANYNDKVFMRNALTYEIFNQMGHYAPRVRFCEVFINDEYNGIYFLTEKIKRDNKRVNITKPDPLASLGDPLSGGYIFKNDNRDPDEEVFISNYSEKGIPGNNQVSFIYVEPGTGEINSFQKSYLSNYIRSFENVLYGPNFQHPVTGYRSFVDVPSFVDYFILGEVSRSVDAYKKSKYFYKDVNSKGGLIVSGPPWDFDWAYKNIPEGNINEECYYGVTDGSAWAYKVLNCGHSPAFAGWTYRLMQDPRFVNSVKTRYTDLRKTTLSFNTIYHFIDSISTLLQVAQQRHYKKWDILGKNSAGSPEVDPQPATFEAAILQFKNWINTRLTWLDKNMPGNYDPSTATQDIGDHFIKLFPNPASDHVNVESNQLLTKTELYTLTGTSILSHTGHQSLIHLDLEQVRPGCYILRSHLKDGSVHSNKLIIR